MKSLILVTLGLLSIASGAEGPPTAKPASNTVGPYRQFGTARKTICGTMKGTKFSSFENTMVDQEMDKIPHSAPFDLPPAGEMCLKLRFDKGNLVEVLEDATMLNHAPCATGSQTPAAEINR